MQVKVNVVTRRHRTGIDKGMMKYGCFLDQHGVYYKKKKKKRCSWPYTIICPMFKRFESSVDRANFTFRAPTEKSIYIGSNVFHASKFVDALKLHLQHSYFACTTFGQITSISPIKHTIIWTSINSLVQKSQITNSLFHNITNSSNFFFPLCPNSLKKSGNILNSISVTFL